MEPLDQIANTISLTMGVAWASGINLYAAILVLGLLGTTGNITLPATLKILTDPMVITAAGVMYFVEFFADKMPGVDTGWDTLHTFIRIPAGALLGRGSPGGRCCGGCKSGRCPDSRYSRRWVGRRCPCR